MATPSPPRQAHSAEYFGEQRDHWWDHDYVSLMLRSWGINTARSVLDLGCGIGHWGRVLLPHLPSDVSLVGLDREPEWVAKAQAIAAARALDSRSRYVQGDATRIPFQDAEFDLVTCQTVLIHMPDAKAAIREMIRVLKPGGCVLVAEPNNLANAQAVGSPRFHEPIDQRLAMTRFQLTCERGKEALGEGDNSIGELVPGLFAQLGLTDIKVSLSNRASPLIPPYADAAQQALRDQILDWSTREFWIWNKDDSRRYFTAGGGTPEDFNNLWLLAMRLAQEEAQHLRDQTYHTAGGGLCYIVAGWKTPHA